MRKISGPAIEIRARDRYPMKTEFISVNLLYADILDIK